MRKHLLCTLICSLFLSLSFGCTSKRTKILYTVYPIGYIIERLVGENELYQSIQSDNSIVQEASIVDEYEDVLDTGKVLFHIGDLEPYFVSHSTDIKNNGITVVDLSSENTVYAFQRYTKQENEDGTVEYVTSPYYEGSTFDSVDMYEKDLCLWLDPITMLSMASDIKDYLVSTNAAIAESIEQNYEDLEEDLISIDAQYQNLANTLERNNQTIKFVSMSSCFGSWQKAFGFEVYPVVLSRYGSMPDDEQLELIENRIKDDDVHYIAYESNMSEEMIDLYNKIKEDCDLTRVDLSNLSSLSDEEYNAGKDYISIFYQNLQSLESIIESK
jgi:zinc transport system substrate-binding protein